MRMGTGKSIYEYENYRTYLKDYYVNSKTENKNFSFRFFARLAGFKAANFIKNVMDGKRNLSIESTEQLAKAMKLNKDESDFFRNLVLFNQATTIDEKQSYAKKITSSRVFKKTRPLQESQFKYFSQWYFIPIREFVAMPTFKEDPEWIAKQLVPPISPHEAKRALEELIKLGLLVREENGRLVQAQAAVTTGNELASVSLAQCHRELLKRASESIDTVPRDKRDISALTIAVSENTAKKVKEMIQKFRKEIIEVVAQEEDPESVYQVNFQLFPIVDVADKKNRKSE